MSMLPPQKGLEIPGGGRALKGQKHQGNEWKCMKFPFREVRKTYGTTQKVTSLDEILIIYSSTLLYYFVDLLSMWNQQML